MPHASRISMSRSAACAALIALLAGCDRDGHWRDARLATGGDPAHGRAAMLHYGCGACHTIPGVPGASSKVGPNLSGIASRMYIAGVLPNTPSNMMRWIEDPQGVDHLTAMPEMGVTPRDARDMASYLYALK
ncbi:MAG TPA: c-type cytochrome [Gemmatimonadaceae bacterium]